MSGSTCALEAFDRHSEDVEFFRALAAISELHATRELAVDEMLQRFASHRECLVHLFTLRLRAIKILEGWSFTLCMDAKQKGIAVHAGADAIGEPHARFGQRTPDAPQ